MPPNPVAMLAASMNRTRCHLGSQAGDVVADLEVEHLGAVDLRQPQQRERHGNGLHDGAHAEPHLERVRIVAVGGGLGFVIERAVEHESAGDLPFRQDRPAESVEGAGRQALRAVRPAGGRAAAR